MALDKKELIAKLSEISELFSKTVESCSEMDEYVPEDHYERKVCVPEFPGEGINKRMRDSWRNAFQHTHENALAMIEEVHREYFAPQKPIPPKKTEFEKPKNTEVGKKLGKYATGSLAGAGIGGFFTLITLFSLMQGVDFYVIRTEIGLILLGAVVYLYCKAMYNKIKPEEDKLIEEALAEYNRQQEKIKAEYDARMEAYEKECAEYELRLKNFMKEYAIWREIYIQSVQEEQEIAEKLEADRVAGVNEIHEKKYLPALEALNACNDLVSDEYLPVLDVIIELLKNGRADDLKEAINLYEDILYRERQLELEREKEENRQREEQMRREEEERYHREQMQFQREQERKRQREAERRLEEEERRRREEMERRDRAEHERRQTEKRETQRQCSNCAKVHRCNLAFKRPNCSSFTPK